MSESFDAVRAIATAWRAANPIHQNDFVVIYDGMALWGCQSVDEVANERPGTYAIGHRGSMVYHFVVRPLSPGNCPTCGCLLPDTVAFDEWDYFHCINDECGARLLLDVDGQPKGYGQALSRTGSTEGGCTP